MLVVRVVVDIYVVELGPEESHGTASGQLTRLLAVLRGESLGQ